MAGTHASGGSFAEGKRLFGLKRWELALKEFIQVKNEPGAGKEDVELAYYMGLCYTKLGRYDDGLLYLEQVITAGADPLRIYQCRLTLAYIYVITNRSRLAEFELSQLMKNGFASAQIYTTLAYAAWVQKNFPRALELYEKALEIDENNTTAMNGIGYILVDTDRDIMKGFKLCRKAVDKHPQCAAYLDSLGWAYYKSGNPQEARMWLRRALDLAPGQEEIRRHIRVVIEDMRP
ncbi:MAG: tetratricopeptide repeat protein [Treponema sp.]|jgi:tetratricopeptide (TPR) repeat protein|nr:tetratricopeptide repeat protein [Treponema sp.]